MLLNNNRTQSKSYLLTAFISIIVILNILIVGSLYIHFNHKQQIDVQYKQNLQKYLLQYNKQQQHFQNYSFYENYDTIIYQNSKLNEDYKEGINYFANITQKQFYKLYQVVKRIAGEKKFGEIAKFGYNYSDWSTKDTIIRDEKGFNTSFIFSALSAIEYQINKKKNGAWITLSAQQIIDCCPECIKSKKPETVFDYIQIYGVTGETQYPYELSRFDTVPKKCRRQEKAGKKYFISGYRTIRNCQALEKQISISPVVVGIDGRNFPKYQYAIFTECQRRTTHYATLVGMGYDHWKLQNSWGRKWGQRGYIRIGPGDTCGVCLKGSAPLLKQDNL